jgi:8-oxo-dGTP diphosphatase
MKYTYNYPRPMVTVDLFIIRLYDGHLEILLIQRNKSPFKGKWALPGGFIDMDENLIDSAYRELLEETGISKVTLFPLMSAGDPGRDPRGRTITIIFTGILSPPFQEIKGGDDARQARWFHFKNLPPMAFDHEKIVASCFEELKYRALFDFWILHFLPDTFSTTDIDSLSKDLFQSKRYSKKILNLAQSLGLIKVHAKNQFSKLNIDHAIGKTAFNRVINIWLSQIK